MPPVVLITGANRGIGREVARQLFVRGFVVFAGTRDPDTTEKIAFEEDSRWCWCPLDVTSDESMSGVCELIRKQAGQLDVLINNAGVIDRAPLIRGEIDTIKTTMEVNFYGPMRVTLAMLPLLRRSGDARVINVSSEMGKLAHLTGGYAGYRLSKAGLNAQTILLANELSGEKIMVNAVCPGWVQTDMGGGGAPRSVEDGADSIVWLATTDQCPSGVFIKDRNVIEW